MLMQLICFKCHKVIHNDLNESGPFREMLGVASLSPFLAT
jgi:hypothetical protein